MITACKILDEATFADARGLVLDRFGAGAVAQLEQIMRNPLRRLCADAGNVGYRDGRAVCLQSAMLRRLYLGREEIFGNVGGMTCKAKKGCPLSLLLETIEKAQVCRHDGKIGFGNSCVKATADMDAENGAPIGPESCTRHLWRAIRPLDCIAYFVRRKLFKAQMPNWKSFSTLESSQWQGEFMGHRVMRAVRVEAAFFDALMKRYLARNEGLFCSRSAEEIDWIFGEKIGNGEAVLLETSTEDGPEGYIILKSDAKARRWSVHDWFAVGNDFVALEALLLAACRFLRQATPAMMLEVEGFPSFVQPVLKRYLPHVRPVGHNQFSWGTGDLGLKKELQEILDTPKSWFFGPYDGDECMS